MKISIIRNYMTDVWIFKRKLSNHYDSQTLSSPLLARVKSDAEEMIYILRWVKDNVDFYPCHLLVITSGTDLLCWHWLNKATISVFTPDSEKKPRPNYKQIIIEDMYKDNINFTGFGDLNVYQGVIQLFDFGYDLSAQVLSSKAAKKLLSLANTEKFDLIIVDLTGLECVQGYIHKFGSPPVIGITAYSHPVWNSYATGNTHNPAYFPEITLPFSNRMTFKERLQNLFLHAITMMYRNIYYMNRVDKMSRAYFGDDTPHIGSFERNMSIIMVNTHFSFDYPQPHVPAIIPVGGLQLKPAQDLPQDLKKLMDEAENGFIFFSLGSNLRSDMLSEEKRKVFLKAFSTLRCKVFWKWESDHLPGQPDSRVMSWCASHPNIRLFITHAGLLSTQEAIYHGVPILGVPFFADQYTNINKAKDHGFGEKVDFATLTTEILLANIQKILQNSSRMFENLSLKLKLSLPCSSYKENAKRISQLYKDQPETPLQRAIFWTEYVLRNNGAHHLRSSSADMPWYQYLLLDVIAVLATGVILVLLLLYKLLSAVFRLANKTTKKKQH
uniref:UDP-glycosyltransferase n=1 Tax=Timema douglasi TaxID=61478 RepID=A0A7R8VMR8_TIMDO|nr:unnamed protein product [Timema douglasi]